MVTLLAQSSGPASGIASAEATENGLVKLSEHISDLLRSGKNEGRRTMEGTGYAEAGGSQSEAWKRCKNLYRTRL
jgi:hypothetical protein